MSFLSDRDYSHFLEQHIGAVDSVVARDHIRGKFQIWNQQYRAARAVERAAELLASETSRPKALYLRCKADLHFLHFLAQRHRFDTRLFRAFLVEDALWDSLEPEWFSPFPVHRVSEWKDREDTVVFTFSDSRPFRDNGRDRGNDYLERFVDLSRLSSLAAIRREADRPLVLYVDYRKVKTLEAIGEAVSDRYTTVGLICDPQIERGGYDHVVREPHFYLWPMIIKTLNPDVVHVNAGWSTQGLPFMPFVPDAHTAVVDFYDVVDLVPDAMLEGPPKERALLRASERYLWQNFRHFVHRCFDPVTEGLKQKYSDADIVSLVEYVKEPMHSHVCSAGKDLTIVYAGIIIQDAAQTDSVYYRRFMAMADAFARDNLHLHIYPSPYLYGFGKPKAVEELIRIHGLANVHACEPLEEDEFVRAVSTCDYGMTPPADTRPCLYPHSLPFKIITYLRAGLPILVPEDLTYLAELVERHNIGVVYRYDDLNRMPEILSCQDVRMQKENVLRFRSLWSIARGGEKIKALYDRILEGARRKGKTVVCAEKPSLAAETAVPAYASPPRSQLALRDRVFLSEAQYRRFLEGRLEQAAPDIDRQYVQRRFQGWAQCYHVERMSQRAGELLAALPDQPFALYLDNTLSLHAAAHLLNGSSADLLARFKGFVAEDGFLATQDVGVFQPYSVCPRSRAQDGSAVVFSMSGGAPSDCPGACLANDYLEKFINLRRFAQVVEQRQSFEPHTVVLYPLYREIHTVTRMARFIRQRDPDLRTLSLVPRPLMHGDFDAVLVEPFLYLWPLIFDTLDPDLVHLNVGWGIQALPFSPFLPDRQRTLVDFYEVLSFLPDTYFEKTHSSAAEVRSAEKHFVRNYGHIMHLCSEETSTRLAEKYDHHGSIVSVTEYLEEPTYDVPPRNDGQLRLVYGGCMLATTSPDDLYYKAFVKVAPHFARGNLHLYIYNSPYVHGTAENDALKQVIRQLGLANVHACKPLELEKFTKVISEYDYGVTLLRPKDMGGEEYNYFMATKLQVYLRAGLPVVIDAYNHYMAGLVERYGIGVVLHDRDLENIPEILNRADLSALKRNVVRFREEFSIEKGGAKVLKMYHDILRKTDGKGRAIVSVPAPRETPRAGARPALAAFEEMIDVMARRENRLYYRDQSARTMSSLAALAQQFDPSVIVELGTLGGLSLRTWIASTKQTRICAVDLSFQTLRETLAFLPADLSRVTLLEQDILKTDFARLWTPQDRVILFVDAHDLPNVPIVEHVLATALPVLPDGSIVVVDDLWYSEEQLTQENARAFLEGRVLGEIDELQCFNGHFAAYHDGGSFMGFAEVIPLLWFVNRHGITLIHDRGSKHAFFVWKRKYLSQRPEPAGEGFMESDGLCGSVGYNPLESVPTDPSLSETMHRIAGLYRQGGLREAAASLSEALVQHPHDEGLSYGLAICLARGGMLSQARDVLACNLRDAGHPRYRRLFDDLVGRVRSCGPPLPASPPQSSNGCGMTIFAMPKPLTGHVATIQKNAIRSWARLVPAPEIILFGDEPGIREMAEEVGARHIPDISRNEFGTPLVDKLFEAAQEHASHAVLAYVNADMIFLQDFVQAVQKVRGRLESFLLIGQRWDIAILDEMDFNDPGWQESLLRQLQEHAILHAECGLDYFVFREGLWPRIPTFAIGRTAWDNWLVMDPHKRGIPVVDGTEFITAVHQDHDYGHVGGGRQEAWNGTEATRNRALAGPADLSGLTTGATWILLKDGTLAKSCQRTPQYITGPYRDQRSAWLLRDARRLITAGATDLAACKCEEALTCLDVWCDLQRMGHAPSEFVEVPTIAERYVTSYVLLAQCQMQMGAYDQVLATYTRLLENPRARMPSAQRDDIRHVRDGLARHLERHRRSVCASVAR